MADEDGPYHLNIGGPRGWTTACGIESASFVSDNDLEGVDCGRCLNTQVFREKMEAKT